MTSLFSKGKKRFTDQYNSELIQLGKKDHKYVSVPYTNSWIKDLDKTVFEGYERYVMA